MPTSINSLQDAKRSFLLANVPGSGLDDSMQDLEYQFFKNYWINPLGLNQVFTGIEALSFLKEIFFRVELGEAFPFVNPESNRAVEDLEVAYYEQELLIPTNMLLTNADLQYDYFIP